MHASLFEIIVGQTSACCALRLALWSVLLCFSVTQARILVISIIALHEFIIGIDQAVDPMILPDVVLNQVYEAFPAVSGFGRMGIANATANIITEMASDKGIVEFLSDLPSLLGTFTRLTDWNGLCRPPETSGDLVLGVFLLLVSIHVLNHFIQDTPLSEALHRVPSPLKDVHVLLECLVQQPDYTPSFLVLVLPLQAYFGRWLLDKAHVLPMSALPIHEHAAAHLIIGLCTTSMLLAFSSFMEFLMEDFGSWYAAYTLEYPRAATARRGETRAVAVSTTTAAVPAG